MEAAQEKTLAKSVRSEVAGSADPFSPEAKDRCRKLVAAVNASHSAKAEETDLNLIKYLDSLYPETTASK